MKKYNIINNVMGWVIFLVAAVTYLLTIEPTASFWDCPEFVAQGYKLEIGHPPGNPMFILAARFAANFAGGDVTAVAKCVNAMSAVLSAATILLLFWTITHLVKKLIVKKNEEENMSLAQYLVIMGSGVCGALAYAWSDTFWFSAVEAEVYAFSSFCTALVFWLILKWENRADDPRSDRYLILIAFIFGISLGVHLLNLLAIPAIALIFYYRRAKKTTVLGSLLTLLISFVIIVLILYGLEPGFVEMAGYFELLFVNSFHMSYNSGVLFYALLLLAVFAFTLFELHRNKSGYGFMKRLGIILSVVLSGMLLIGNGFFIPFVLIIGLTIFIFVTRRVSSRLFGNIILSMMMIFIGFSSYALVLIRSNANLPLDENSPNSPFALTSYLSRDQYGKSPLFYGYTMSSPVIDTEPGSTKYSRVVKTNPNQPDEYEGIDQKDYVYASETEMLFPRIHSRMHANDYASILGYNSPEEIGDYVTVKYKGQEYPGFQKPTMAENLEFFFGYQLHHMYWRYFMWNFAGRQNDIASNGPGDVARGNWLSGIPFLDNLRLNNLEYVPDEFGKDNKGHNVFFMLPLLLGLIGLFWQAFSGKKGIEQFWVVFFLFFMTGIAIVMYLNQTPSQPRERDYAYAGSFYAYAIWIGMGVAGIWKIAISFLYGKKEKKKENEQSKKVETVSSTVVENPIVTCFKKYATFTGRASRSEFWLFFLFINVISIIFELIDSRVSSIFSLVTFLPNVAVAVRRMHDTGHSGWCCLIPIYNLILCFKAGDEDKNQYGEKPLSKGSLVKQTADIEADELNTVEEPIEKGGKGKLSLALAVVAAIIGLVVPLQMVSQTWDDHDRSGRYCARDFGENYLQSLDKDAIIFCNGDNDTFPLWYLQEVEGVRTDVRAVNLSYLSTDWYIAQMQRAAYDSKPLPMYAGPTTYAYDKRQGGGFDLNGITSQNPVDANVLFKNYYDDNTVVKDENGMMVFSNSKVLIPTNVDAAIKNDVIPKYMRDIAQDSIIIDLNAASGGGMSASQTMTIDLFASSAAQGWKRPVYFASTVPESLFMGLRPYMLSTGLCYQVTPALVNSNDSEIHCNTDKMYNIVTTKFKWGGLDKAPKGSLYLDETVMRMVSTMRLQLMSLASSLSHEGLYAKACAGDAKAMYQLAYSNMVFSDDEMIYWLSRAAESGYELKSEEKDYIAYKPLSPEVRAQFELAEKSERERHSDSKYADDRFKKAEEILNLMEEKMPAETAPYQNVMALRLAQYYADIYQYNDSETARQQAIKVLERESKRMAQYCIFYESMTPEDINIGNLTQQDQDMMRATTLLFDSYRKVNPKGFDKFVEQFASVEKSGKTVSEGMINLLKMDENERRKLREEAEASENAAPEPQQIPIDAQNEDQAQTGIPFNGPVDAVVPKGTEMEDVN